MNEEIQTFQLTSRRLTELSKSSLVTEIIFFVEGNFFIPSKAKMQPSTNWSVRDEEIINNGSDRYFVLKLYYDPSMNM